VADRALRNRTATRHPELAMNDVRAEYLAQLGIDVYVPRTTPKAATAPAEVVETGTTERATAGMDWQTLRHTVAACTLCDLHRTRTQTVFGVGNPNADWLVIGEAPGAEEDARGEPFVGRAGQLLNSMLKAVGLAREQVFIANILKCRPPNNRDPKPEEAVSCRPYLERQIALIGPKVILAVGRIAAQNLLATDTPIGRLRGRVHTFGASRTPLVVTYHPAYLLRSPGEKRKAWTDLKLAVEVLTRGRLAQ
jgi:uracil-DNA glycosylase family 4